MTKLRPFAFYALVTPLVTLGTAPVLAERSAEQGVHPEPQTTPRNQGSAPSAPAATDTEQRGQRAGDPGSRAAGDGRTSRDTSGMQNGSYLASVPANGMSASDLIGANVRTTGDEDVGSVTDLILDENGRVVAIVVGVGGFLGMGEKTVAIGWGGVTRSARSDKPELGAGTPQLRVDATREELSAAPEFGKPD